MNDVTVDSVVCVCVSSSVVASDIKGTSLVLVVEVSTNVVVGVVVDSVLIVDVSIGRIISITIDKIRTTGREPCRVFIKKRI